MPLQPGSRLGPYEIVAVLGAGGMGEVYRARDPRIGREVAVKVLPPAFAESEDRRRRFEQEARAAGALSHPSLLTVFDVGSQDGLLFIVSELLEGMTLRERLQQNGALPQRRAVDYALQIARAAAVAHEKNIVHRDLKPDNIFITSDERVKLLDFGLAKVLDDRGGIGPDTPTEVQRSPNTSSGMIMGTVSYMAPEQVRAQNVDHRTDIFSAGVVLYEMVTGALPFRAESHVETMTAILNDDPPPMKGVPPALEKIILHALEKSPAQRFQSMRDMAFALETFSSAPLADPGVKPRTKARAASSPEVPAHGVVYRRVSYRRGFVMSARFAPDGSVVYGATWEDQPNEIFAAYPANPESRPLNLGHADVLAISPGGEMAISLGRRFVGGWVTSGRLARVPLFGGAPREVAEDVVEADWDPAGKELAGIRRTPGGFAVEMPLGNPIVTAPHWLSHVRVSPNGDRLAFLEHELWGDDAGRLVIVDRQGRRLAQSERFPSATGVAWRSQDEVWTAAHHDVAGRDFISLTVRGKQRIVLPVPGRFAIHDIARDGRVLASVENGRREIVAGTRGEERERNITWLDWSFMSALSPDGKTVLFEEQGQARRGDNNSVYVRRTDGSPAVRLGEGAARAFSPDGTMVGVIPRGGTELHLVPIGVGTPRTVPLQGLQGCTWWDWTPDGRTMIVWAHHGEGQSRHFALPLDGSGPPRPVGPPGPGLHIAFSPDSKAMLVSMHDRSVAIMPLDGGDPHPVPGTRAGDVPLQWSEDGGAVFVFQPGRVQVTIERVDLATGARTLWHEIHPSDPAGIMDVMPVLMSRDGQQYAYCYRRFISDLYIIEGL